MLLGINSDLFTFTVDEHVDAQGGLVPSLEVFGMGVTFGEDIKVDAHFKFAYDTFGLRQMLNHLTAGDTSHVAADIKDGYYISADSYFELGGRLTAGVGVQVGIYGA
jgi:hypothetical protein